MSHQFRSASIIAMTANAMEGDRERCLQAGMNDYVAKPIKPQELYAAIDRCLDIPDVDLQETVPSTDAATVSLDLAAAARDIGDADLLLTMATMLLGEWDQHLARIATAIRERDTGKTSINAHTVKSLMAMFHAENARRLALDLEQAVKADAAETDWPQCHEIAETLAREMARLKPEIERFASRNRAI